MRAANKYMSLLLLSLPLLSLSLSRLIKILHGEATNVSYMCLVESFVSRQCGRINCWFASLVSLVIYKIILAMINYLERLNGTRKKERK